METVRFICNLLCFFPPQTLDILYWYYAIKAVHARVYKCVLIMWRLTVNSITRGTSSNICVQAERRRHSRLLAIACNQSLICFEAWHPLCILITCTSHSLLTIGVCNLRPGFTPGAWCCSLVHWDQNCNGGRTQHPAPRFNITHAARRACIQRVPWNTCGKKQSLDF